MTHLDQPFIDWSRRQGKRQVGVVNRLTDAQIDLETRLFRLLFFVAIQKKQAELAASLEAEGDYLRWGDVLQLLGSTLTPKDWRKDHVPS